MFEFSFVEYDRDEVLYRDSVGVCECRFDYVFRKV